jgi:hypothetical protein
VLTVPEPLDDVVFNWRAHSALWLITLESFRCALANDASMLDHVPSFCHSFIWLFELGADAAESLPQLVGNECVGEANGQGLPLLWNSSVVSIVAIALSLMVDTSAAQVSKLDVALDAVIATWRLSLIVAPPLPPNDAFGPLNGSVSHRAAFDNDQMRVLAPQSQGKHMRSTA